MADWRRSFVSAIAFKKVSNYICLSFVTLTTLYKATTPFVKDSYDTGVEVRPPFVLKIKILVLSKGIIVIFHYI